MDNSRNIERVFNLIDRNLFYADASLDYDRIQDALILLVEQIEKDTSDDSEYWYLGECGNCSLMDLIVGAYWHFSEWSGGQASKSYLSSCVLGRIFSPGMSSIDDEPENAAYLALNDLAREELHQIAINRG